MRAIPKRWAEIERLLDQVLDQREARERQRVAIVRQSARHRACDAVRCLEMLTAPPLKLRGRLEAREALLKDDADALRMFRAAIIPPKHKHHADTYNVSISHSNRRDYTLTRLHAHRPEFYQRVVAGELSAHAAPLQADSESNAPTRTAPALVAEGVFGHRPRGGRAMSKKRSSGKRALIDTDRTRCMRSGSSTASTCRRSAMATLTSSRASGLPRPSSRAPAGASCCSRRSPSAAAGANVIGGKHVFPGTYAVRSSTRAVFTDLSTEFG